VFVFVDHTKLDNNRRFLRVFSEQSTIMDIYVQVGNNVSLVVKRIIEVKRLCLTQKKCIEELTKQKLSLQDKNDGLLQTILHQKKCEKLDDLNKLTKQNSSLQQKNDKLKKKLDDLNKSYSDMMKNLGFDEDNSLVTPHTPEKTSRIQKTRGLSTLTKKELLFDPSTGTPPPQKQKQRQQRLGRGRTLVKRVNNDDDQSPKPQKRRVSLRKNNSDKKRSKQK